MMPVLDHVAIRYILPLLICIFGAILFLEFSGDSTIDVDVSNQQSYPGIDSPGASNRYQKPAVGKGIPVAVGQKFISLAELDSVQNAANFVRIGLFGNSWPASIVEVKHGIDGIRFKRSDGTPHNYKGFEGYRVQMVRLVGSNDETIAVYRAQHKRY